MENKNILTSEQLLKFLQEQKEKIYNDSSKYIEPKFYFPKHVIEYINENYKEKKV